ncbi:SCA7-domain-containing protein [Conidiobolus coronatus NRRL 28638]|uniref:SCA7-domain-containing protein n=1 Tax=Conidiobolus coronatus (strain ATCC 28846 / CBS 209.66 / NRRL 28638) TaxID=796925 RepID=A0A137P3Y1_CONC2|nr:SCA7-domain-containing protein [Conidiobolus coronatus NRRL 28638]|eukprot:KXN69726.1 SCA7-domain-containing protein [Conidiobolus coronatus NRRL 28638]
MSDTKDTPSTGTKRPPSQSTDAQSTNLKSKKKQKKELNPIEKLDNSYLFQSWAPLVNETTAQVFSKEKDWKPISIKISKPKKSNHINYKRNLPTILNNLNLNNIPIYKVVENAFLPYSTELPNPDEIPTTVAPVEQDETQAMMNDSQTNVDSIIEDDPNRKKIKKDSKSKRKPAKPKVTGPIDLERQCGVIGNDGKPCTRTITCKTHSVALKRAVVGRSTTYDDLVRKYNQNNAKLKAEQLKSQNKTEPEVQVHQVKEIEEESDYDSDKELEIILNCLHTRNSHLQPVASRPLFNNRSNYQNFAMRSMLSGALRDVPK